MADVVFEDYTIEVQGAMDDRINATLEECAGELEARVKRNTRVDTGRTKNSFRHIVDDASHTATVGSSEENAIWEEFGTGEYAREGNGRRGGWVYKTPDGKYFHTYGKRPSRAFWNAYTALKDAIINRLRNSLNGM